MIRFLLLHVFLARCCFCQLKQCYRYDGTPTTDLPCDPNANVSACCGQDRTCSTNLYCSGRRGKYVGSCTDKEGRDPACPFPYWGKFDYTLNATTCDDGTICPNANNAACCFNHQGIKEIVYHYKAPLPTIAASLSEFYAANGYQVATGTSSSSNTSSNTALSISTSVSPTKTTAPPSTSTIASQTKFAALPSSSSDRPPTDQGMATSGLNSGTKAGIGVGATIGVSVAGILLYFLVCRLRRRYQRDMVHASTLTKAEVTPPGSRRYEKPEMTGEDARKELDAAERREAELAGGQTRIELGDREIHEMLV